MQLNFFKMAFNNKAVNNKECEVGKQRKMNDNTKNNNETFQAKSFDLIVNKETPYLNC